MSFAFPLSLCWQHSEPRGRGVMGHPPQAGPTASEERTAPSGYSLQQGEISQSTKACPGVRSCEQVAHPRLTPGAAHAERCEPCRAAAVGRRKQSSQRGSAAAASLGNLSQRKVTGLGCGWQSRSPAKTTGSLMMRVVRALISYSFQI